MSTSFLWSWRCGWLLRESCSLDVTYFQPHLLNAVSVWLFTTLFWTEKKTPYLLERLPSDIHGPHRMNPNNVAVPLTHQRPGTSQNSTKPIKNSTSVRHFGFKITIIWFSEDESKRSPDSSCGITGHAGTPFYFAVANVTRRITGTLQILQWCHL